MVKIATKEPDLLPLAYYQYGMCDGNCIHDTTFDPYSFTCQVCCKVTADLKKGMAELDRELEDEMINGTDNPSRPDVDMLISEVLDPKKWILP